MEKRDLITFWQEVHTIVDDAVEKRNHSISIFFHPENGFSVNVSPWPDADELYDMYQKGRITANDFRAKMGLPMVRNAEKLMKHSFLDRQLQIPTD